MKKLLLAALGILATFGSANAQDAKKVTVDGFSFEADVTTTAETAKISYELTLPAENSKVCNFSIRAWAVGANTFDEVTVSDATDENGICKGSFDITGLNTNTDYNCFMEIVLSDPYIVLTLMDSNSVTFKTTDGEGGGTGTKNMAAAFVDADYTFSDVTEHTAVLSGKINVTDVAEGWQVRIAAAGSPDHKIENVNYDKWYNDDIIWGETTITPVNGENEFTINIANIPSGSIPCYMKLVLVNGTETKGEAGAGPWYKPEYKDPVNPATELTLTEMNVDGVDFIRESSTSGKLPYNIRVSVPEGVTVDHYRIFVVTFPEEEGQTEDKVLGQNDNAKLVGTIDLSNLNSESTTQSWFKIQAFDAAGNLLNFNYNNATVQTPEKEIWLNTVQQVPVTNIVTSITAGQPEILGPTQCKVHVDFTVDEKNDAYAHVTGYKIYEGSENPKGYLEITDKKLREAVLTLSHLGANESREYTIKIEALLDDEADFKSNVAECQVLVNTEISGSEIGEAVKTYESSIKAADRDDDNNIIWKSPIESIEDFDEGISGDYIQRNTTVAGEETPAHWVWTKNFNYKICNDAEGHIFGEVDFHEGVPDNLDAAIYINRIRYELNVVNNKATFSTGSFTYCNNRTVSILFYLAYNDKPNNHWGNSQTRVITYKIENCNKTKQSIEFDELVDWDNSHTLAGKVYQYSTTEAVEGEPKGDWQHTALPVDVGEDKVEYWNPDFDYMISNPLADDAATEVPITVSVELAEGTMIPSNFDPQFFVYPLDADGNAIPQGDGILRYGPYAMNPVPDVVNMYTGSSASIATQEAGSTNNDGKFKNGNYHIEFYYAYVPIRESNGFSQTRGILYSVDNGNNVHDDTTGIEDIIEDVDVNAPIEFYNLQGVRVENPANGLYIRRQGNKVSKVVIR